MTIAVMEAAMTDPGGEKLINCKWQTRRQGGSTVPKRAITFLPGWRDSGGYGRRAVPADRAHGGRGRARTILNELAEFLDRGQAGPVVVGTSDMRAMIGRA